MKIQKMHIAPIQPALLPGFERLVNDPTHNIAWTPDVRRLIPFAPTGTHPVMPGVTLQTANLSDVHGVADAKRRKKLQDISLTFATKTGALLKHQFPKLEGTVTGIEFVVASTRAVQSWADPERTTIINPSIKTAQAVLSGLDALKSYTPRLAGMSSQLKTIGLLVSIGDVIYQLYTVWEDDDADQPDSDGQKKPSRSGVESQPPAANQISRTAREP